MSEMMQRVQNWDDKWIIRLIALRGTGLTRFMKTMSVLGDGWFYVLASVAVFFMYSLETHWLLMTVVAFLAELILYKLIKSGTTRPRPYQANAAIENLVIPPDQFSFPSGHTAAATVFAFSFGMLIPALIPFLCGFVLLVATSRVYLGVHYPSDVVAGGILGIVSCLVGMGIAGI